MFKSCLGLSKQNDESDEIVKAHAFDGRNYVNKSNYTPKYETVSCNDYDLYKLRYLGPLFTNFVSLKHFFGKPQIFDCYKGPYSFEFVWYIEFKDGTKASICKSFKNNIESKYNDKWKVYGSNETVMNHIILLFL